MEYLRTVKYTGTIFDTMSEAQSISDSSGIARDLTAFQQNILVILAEEPRYGLAIKRELESYYGTEVNHGRLYPNLDTLVEKGLVEKGQRDRRTNYYTLTRRGSREIDARTDWEADYIEH